MDFKQLGTTIGWTGAVCVGSLICFGIAVRFGANPELAPRTWARPKAVIKNVLRQPYFLSWIPWTLSLSYKEMLEGIDGTGTRKNGWSGSFLKSNLDGVIVCKFNSLCFKVSCLATFLCVLVTLPLNYTAGCDPRVSGADVCKNITGLTDFEKTTLANIPGYGSSALDEEAIRDSGAFDPENIWTFIKDVIDRGPIAIWEYVQEKLSELWDMVLSAARNWIMTRIIASVTTKLLSMLDPTGIMAVINSVIAIYRAIQSFIEQLRVQDHQHH